MSFAYHSTASFNKESVSEMFDDVVTLKDTKSESASSPLCKNSVNFKPFVALVAQWSMSEKILHMSLIRRGLNPTNPPTEI